PAAQQVSREEIVKSYYDYALGAGNGALLPGRRKSSFVFEPHWSNRPWPPADKYGPPASDEELGLLPYRSRRKRGSGTAEWKSWQRNSSDRRSVAGADAPATSPQRNQAIWPLPAVPRPRYGAAGFDRSERMAWQSSR